MDLSVLLSGVGIEANQYLQLMWDKTCSGLAGQATLQPLQCIVCLSIIRFWFMASCVIGSPISKKSHVTQSNVRLNGSGGSQADGPPG